MVPLSPRRQNNDLINDVSSNVVLVGLSHSLKSVAWAFCVVKMAGLWAGVG